jgi:multidrug efflux pump subunit AcrA (membrane-fusion protein)
LPLTVLLGFVGLIAWSARESLLPSTPVTIVPVYLGQAEVQQSGTPLFQAAGWIEPRPTAVVVTALAEGVVERLLVVEGQAVEAGEPVATLLSRDAELALADAKAALHLKEAELAATEAELIAAKTAFEQPLQLQGALADADSQWAKIRTEMANLPFATRAAQARFEMAEKDLAGKQSAGDAIAGRSLQRAQSEANSSAAALEELKSRLPNLVTEAEALERKRTALRQQLQNKTEEKRRLAEAEANVKAAEARVRAAMVAVDVAELQVDRMTLRSPITGCVLGLHAQPGKRLMGLNAASERDASTVVSLYDPTSLQVRADVRLEDVRQVVPGQPVQIGTAALDTPLSGTVLMATSIADIQKNTLQVKVAINEPPAVIRPEMLVQVTFLAPERLDNKSNESEERMRMLIPRQLVNTAEGSTRVWLADQSSGTAHLRTITLGTASTGELVEVAEGLSPTDKLIASGREQLENGGRIRVTGQDESLGTTGPVSMAVRPDDNSPVTLGLNP